MSGRAGQAQLDLEAPRETELIVWPSVNGAQPLGRIRVELVRATVGCRELELLVGELGGSHEDKAAETPDALLLSEEPRLGATYVGPGRRFEGAIRLRQLIEPAQESLVVVDSYMDDGTFALAAAAPDGISRRFLSSDHPVTRPRVTQTWADWQGQWEGDSECRIGSGLPHFRLLIVDRAAYHVDASFKDFGSSLTFFRMLPTDELRQIESTIDSMWDRATSVRVGSEGARPA